MLPMRASVVAICSRFSVANYFVRDEFHFDLVTTLQRLHQTNGRSCAAYSLLLASQLIQQCIATSYHVAGYCNELQL